MPSTVKKLLTTDGLVFLGFQFDDWEFRTLLRGVLPREGVAAGSAHSNVAVQVEPDSEVINELDSARRYMEKYFSQNRRIDVNCGTSEAFLTELTKQWNQIKH
jgi:hypothetical protein